MKSKTLLAANILATTYSIILLWALIGLTVINSGGENIINSVGGFFESAFELIGMSLAIINYLYLLAVSLFVHIGLFIAGCIVSWIAYVTKKDNVATVAAVVYLIGTICSPVCLAFGIPVTALAFVGANNQRKLNKSAEK